MPLQNVIIFAVAWHATLTPKESPTYSVPLKISDAPKDLQDKWTSILKECTKQLTMTSVKFHQGQAAHQEQLAVTLIHNARHIIIPEYITTVPDINYIYDRVLY